MFTLHILFYEANPLRRKFDFHGFPIARAANRAKTPPVIWSGVELKCFDATLYL
jgi:hypothetical protein